MFKKGVSSKGTTNIKSMNGVPTGNIEVIPLNGWVEGELNASGTDFINLTAWYRPTGEKRILSVPCKASVVNMVLSDVVVIPPPDPDPDPTPVYKPVNVEVNVDSAGETTVVVDGQTFVKSL